jgi:hypothetical protein
MDQIPSSSIARPSKVYPNLDFGFENKPSGNPDDDPRKGLKVISCLRNDRYGKVRYFYPGLSHVFLKACLHT